MIELNIPEEYGAMKEIIKACCKFDYNDRIKTEELSRLCEAKLNSLMDDILIQNSLGNYGGNSRKQKYH